MEASSLPRRGVPLPRSPRLLAPLGDERLVEQVRRGNGTAFEVIYDRHHGGILSFCRHMLGSREEAEDAVQHTFVAAHRNLLEGDREIRLKPWLYAIARNRCLSILRSRREHASEVPELATAGLSEEVEQRTDLREMLADLSELPEHQRAALVLSELGDLPHVEVAQVLGCEVPKVKSLVFQARSALIDARHAREAPCEEIREQIATASGGALRRGPLRRHLQTCEACASFRDEVRRQRRMMAVLLPVVPSVGLKRSALAAAGVGGGAGGGTAGGLLGALGGGGTAKVVTAAIAVSGVAAAGGVVGGTHGGGHHGLGGPSRGAKAAGVAAGHPAKTAPGGRAASGRAASGRAASPEAAAAAARALFQRSGGNRPPASFAGRGAAGRPGAGAARHGGPSAAAPGHGRGGGHGQSHGSAPPGRQGQGSGHGRGPAQSPGPGAGHGRGNGGGAPPGRRPHNSSPLGLSGQLLRPPGGHAPRPLAAQRAGGRQDGAGLGGRGMAARELP